MKLIYIILFILILKFKISNSLKNKFILNQYEGDNCSGDILIHFAILQNSINNYLFQYPYIVSLNCTEYKELNGCIVTFDCHNGTTPGFLFKPNLCIGNFKLIYENSLNYKEKDYCVITETDNLNLLEVSRFKSKGATIVKKNVEIGNEGFYDCDESYFRVFNLNKTEIIKFSTNYPSKQNICTEIYSTFEDIDFLIKPILK